MNKKIFSVVLIAMSASAAFASGELKPGKIAPEAKLCNFAATSKVLAVKASPTNTKSESTSTVGGTTALVAR